ncbi:MAG: DUF4062 domain-containing protein [Candidatus Omnitrophica bacterium]|nr:DUF4062 domain-containing protein [Candidatus Omnitrophota bacterium]
MKYKIFFSSVQKELKEERRALRDYIYGDALLSRFFDVFLFEDLPASDRRADDVYLEEVKTSDIYLGLFGNQYGAEDSEGISPTHKEFLLATQLGKPRFIFVKGDADTARHPKMLALLHLAGDQLIRRRFNTAAELHSAVYASLVHYLLGSGRLLTGPFDATVCRNAELNDISKDKIRWFLTRARNARDYALADMTPVFDALTHLNLLDKGKPNHAAILLFGIKPQRFLVTSEVKCMHFHGTQKLKPIPSYQIYKGTIFDMIDQSVDFVMSKLNRFVGTRAQGPQAPVEYDIPQEVVVEGIVNAVAHRDYTSNASVEIMLFADRFEVWNPGALPPSLTIESLSRPHSSQPANPLIAEPLFLAKYIEKAGTGTVDMYDQCRKAGMRPLEFRVENGFFILTIWRKQLAKKRAVRAAGQDEAQEAQAEAQEAQVHIANWQRDLLSACKKTEQTGNDLVKIAGYKARTGNFKRGLQELLDHGLLEMTIPDKPTSTKQKYRLTKKGAEYLKKHEKDK